MKNIDRRMHLSSRVAETRDDKDRLIDSRRELTVTYEAAILPIDTPTANGRVYPRSAVEKAVIAYRKHMTENHGFGECDPETPGTAVQLANVSHRTNWLYADATHLRARVVTTQTPRGTMLAGLFERAHEKGSLDSFPFDLSVRGVGSVTDAGVVGDDFEIISLDFVSNEPTLKTPRLQSGGYVNWPLGLYDDGQGGMVVTAVVRKSYELFEPAHSASRGWAKSPGLFAEDHQLDESRPMDPGMLACVPLGYSFGCWWHRGPDPEHPTHTPWKCTLEDLTAEGRALVKSLEALYGAPVELITYIDT